MTALSSYCGALTLQVGVAISAVLFFAISALILAANVFDYRYSSGWHWHLNLMLALIFAAALILLGAFLFAAAFNEVRSWALVAAVGIFILLAFWVILCCLSFFGMSDHREAVCIETRCPESFWIANLGYRGRKNDTTDLALHLDFVASTSADGFQKGIFSRHMLGALSLRREPPAGRIPIEPKSVHNLLQEPSGSIPARIRRAESKSYTSSAKPDVSSDQESTETRKAQDNRGSSTDSTQDANDAQNGEGLEMGKVKKMNYTDPFMVRQNAAEFSTTSSGNTATGDDEDRNSNGIERAFPFSGAVILFIANLVFLLYTAVLAWSYASELDWADYQVEDELYYSVAE